MDCYKESTGCPHPVEKQTVIRDVPVANPETLMYMGCFDRVLCHDCGHYSEETLTNPSDCTHVGRHY